MIASAPGKLVLLGDFAVLGGAPALVAAVNRRAEGRWVEIAPPPSSVVQAVLREAGSVRSSGGIEIDTSAFLDASSQKLGIGSSAAAAVVAAALVTERADLATRDLAVRAHRAASGGGSGIDVLASFHGGVIKTRHAPSEPTRCAEGIGGLDLFVFFAGVSASTQEIVDACRRSARWSDHVERMTELSGSGIAAWERGDGTAFIDAVGAYGRQMGALGRDAGVPIAEGAVAELMKEASALGGAAKPSGAGVGDVVIAFGRGRELGDRLARTSGLTRIELGIERRGLMIQSPVVP